MRRRSFSIALSLALAGCAVRGPLFALDASEDALDGALVDADAQAEDGRDAPASEGGACSTPVVDSTRAFDLSLGESHGCAIDRGALRCWGANDEGALGAGDTVDRTSPTALTVGRWVAVAAGDDSTCAIDDARAVWCWGANGSGQLGLGDTLARSRPGRVAALCDARLISGAFDHYCVIDGASRLYCWGRNSEGQLGQADEYPGRNALAPLEVMPSGRWRAVATGDGHTCALQSDRSLWCWGRNPDGQLGLGAGTSIQIRSPQRVGTLSDWERLDVAQDQSCAIRAGGELYCWGAGDALPLGLQRAPVRIGAFGDWSTVAVSTFAACGTRRAGGLYCWGRNAEGQLGLGTIEPRTEPALATLGATLTGLSLGRFHGCARDATAVYCTGENNRGQLGVGDRNRRSVFTAQP